MTKVLPSNCRASRWELASADNWWHPRYSENQDAKYFVFCRWLPNEYYFFPEYGKINSDSLTFTKWSEVVQ